MIPFGSSEKKVRLLRMELAVRSKTHHIAIVFRRGSVKTLVTQFLRQILAILFDLRVSSQKREECIFCFSAATPFAKSLKTVEHSCRVLEFCLWKINVVI